MNPFYVVLLGFTVSIDAFVAGMAYGMKGIIISFRSLSIAGLVTGLCTAIAMATAYFLGSFLNPGYAAFGGAALLIALGCWNILQEYLHKNMQAYPFGTSAAIPNLKIELGRIIISIMVKPETADMDQSKEINSVEAIFLGLALGVDNMVATFAAALMGMLPPFTPILMALIQMLLIVAGIQLSKYILGEKLKQKFPYLPGAILIILGLTRLCK